MLKRNIDAPKVEVMGDARMCYALAYPAVAAESKAALQRV